MGGNPGWERDGEVSLPVEGRRSERKEGTRTEEPRETELFNEEGEGREGEERVAPSRGKEEVQ